MALAMAFSDWPAKNRLKMRRTVAAATSSITKTPARYAYPIAH
jgi:hypothetical protein